MKFCSGTFWSSLGPFQRLAAPRAEGFVTPRKLAALPAEGFVSPRKRAAPRALSFETPINLSRFLIKGNFFFHKISSLYHNEVFASRKVVIGR